MRGAGGAPGVVTAREGVWQPRPATRDCAAQAWAVGGLVGSAPGAAGAHAPAGARLEADGGAQILKVREHGLRAHPRTNSALRHTRTAGGGCQVSVVEKRTWEPAQEEQTEMVAGGAASSSATCSTHKPFANFTPQSMARNVARKVSSRSSYRASISVHAAVRPGRQISYAWRLIFLILAPSEHFSVAKTAAVSYIIYYSHNTSRPCPSGTIQAQPAAHSDRSKRPEDAEKRLHF